MPLWKKTDTENAASKPKFVKVKEDGATIAQDNSGKQLVFVDDAEAAKPENKAKGISGAGWYQILKTATRMRVEKLVAIARAPRATAGDVEDSEDPETPSSEQKAGIENP